MIIQIKTKYGMQKAFHLSTGRLLNFNGPFEGGLIGKISYPPVFGIEISEISSPPLTPDEIFELGRELIRLGMEMKHGKGALTC